MLSSFRAMKFALAILAAVMLAGVPAVAHAATGSVRIVITRLGFVAGGGSGTLHFRGKRYPLRVSGGAFRVPSCLVPDKRISIHLAESCSSQSVISAITMGTPMSDLAMPRESSK